MSTPVLVAVNDLFFFARIRQTAELLGVAVKQAKGLDQLLSLARSERPKLIILDLNNPSADAIEAISQLKADDDLKAIRTLGYFSHVQVELKERARLAGCNQVLPKSAFTERLSQILREAGGGDDPVAA
jgi:two-component system cell cycle response regulator DivK